MIWYFFIAQWQQQIHSRSQIVGILWLYCHCTPFYKKEDLALFFKNVVHASTLVCRLLPSQKIAHPSKSHSQTSWILHYLLVNGKQAQLTTRRWVYFSDNLVWLPQGQGQHQCNSSSKNDNEKNKTDVQVNQVDHFYLFSLLRTTTSDQPRSTFPLVSISSCL